MSVDEAVTERSHCVASSTLSGHGAVTTGCEHLVVLAHQAFCYELDPSAQVSSALSSHAGASRFAFNWGLALVKSRLELRDQSRTAAYKELLCDEDAEALAKKVAVPWSLPSLRKEWNRSKADVAPWWAENSKEAYNSGLDALARALEGFFAAKGGTRAGTVGFPRFKTKGAKKSCRFTTGAIKVVDHHHVQLPRIGLIRTKEGTEKFLSKLAVGTARILSATVGSGRPLVRLVHLRGCP